MRNPGLAALLENRCAAVRNDAWAHGKKSGKNERSVLRLGVSIVKLSSEL